MIFSLLRLALGASAETIDLSSLTKVDWKELIGLSFEQGVAAIAVDGLQKFYEANSGLELALDKPELESLKYEWFGEVFAREEKHKEQVKAIRQLVKLWAENGLKVYALKGLSFAQYYPSPKHRYSCDFDCNVRFASSNLPAWDVADHLAKDYGIAVDDCQSKHSIFVVNGMSVENHRHVIGVNGNRKLKMFDAYLQELLVTSEERLIADLPLEAPCWLFNALFCIAHAQVHFLEEDGIMLKHVLDWIQIRKDSQAALFREQFDADIDRFELRKFFDVLDGVCDYVVGSKTELTEAERLMLEAILDPKDVRLYKSNFLAHLNILRMLWNNRWKYRRYSETNAFAVMWRYIYGHFFDNDVPR